VTQAAHILVVDDDKRIRNLLSSYLAERGYRVTTAENAAEARQKLAGLNFDLAILDIMMPGESGLELARHLRAQRQMALLILSARGSLEDRIAGLEFGADDYLPKPFEPRELLLRIENLLRRSYTPEEELIRFGDCVYALHARELKRNGRRIPLSGQETAILHSLARRPNVTLSRAELAAGIGGVSERTVDVYVNRLRRKIEDDNVPSSYLLTVRGLGYTLRI
jgi:two-component system phosphate regulon response regulator OmpR